MTENISTKNHPTETDELKKCIIPVALVMEILI